MALFKTRETHISHVNINKLTVIPLFSFVLTISHTFVTS